LVTVKEIANISTNPLINEFAAFIIEAQGDRHFPVLKALDLLNIPHLVQYLWKIDYGKEDGESQTITFTGTEVDRFWQLNASTAGSVEDLYKIKYNQDIMPRFYLQSLQEGKVAYSRRKATFSDELGKVSTNIEAIFFPCSSDGKTVDSGIGLVEYFSRQKVEGDVFMLL